MRSVHPALFLILFSILPAQSLERQVLSQHIPAAAQNAVSTGSVSHLARLNLAIGLPLRNQQALKELLDQLYDRASTNYHRFLTPQQFTERFGPTEEDYQAVIHFAQVNGLIVTGKHSNRALLELNGSVASIQKAFHVNLLTYEHPTEHRSFFAPDTEPSVDLAVPILAISGLDNYIVPRPLFKTFDPNDPNKPRPANGSGPLGFYLGYDFRHAYVPGVPLTGSGQSLALVEFDGYYPQDVAAYKALAGLPDVPIYKVLLDNFNGNPGPGNIEVSLDIDMAISMAPGLSQVIVYEGSVPNSVLNRIASDKLAQQISASWTYAVNAVTLQIFQQFAAQGQSFYNASGDAGAYAGPVLTPSDNPYITVVGGTDLIMTSGGGTYVSETTWPGTGGGISTTYAIPSWQQGISMTANHGSTTMRNLPDVSMVADSVWLIANNGLTYVGSGTSISAPLWAGFTAMMNELALANGEPLVGFINPALYSFAKDSGVTAGFHDIITGNNKNATSPNDFSAVSGYDLCTGWGSPRASLLTELALPEPLRINPFAAVVFSGGVGGPFIPPSQTFTLTNHATGSLDWLLVNPAPWLDVSPTNGTLVSGGPSTTVTVSLNSAASNLVVGSYRANLTFTNLSNSFGQKRVITLALVTPPLITAQPADQAVLQGGTAMFSITTATNALLFFQWTANGTPLTNGSRIFGATNSTLIISNVSPANVGAYSVVVSNVAGVMTSSNAALTIVPSAPVITLQPTNQTVPPGAPATFSVAAIGNIPFSYQWQLNGTNLISSANISGETSNSVTVRSVSSAEVGAYSVIITNSLGSTTSIVAMLSVTPVTAAGVAMTTLSTFVSGNDGAYLFCPLVQIANGNLYGTTIQGGANGYGTIFRAGTNGSRATLFTFNNNNGSAPFAGLVQGRDGSFYGLTAQGGTYGDGIAFKLSGTTVSTLATFNANNGLFPVAGLVQATDGNFYGSALEGGAYGYGTIFRMTSGGTLTTLVALNGTSGAFPSGVLVQGTDGNFYGTTENGGTNGGAGTVFKMAPSGAFTSIYSFSGGNDGGVPVPGLVQATDGNFYGTTLQGGRNGGFGTVFQITPSGALTTLYSFAGGPDGDGPWGGLMLGRDGNLYGTTQGGGTYGFGTVFRIAPNGPLAKLVDFDGYNGSYPSAALIQGSDNSLFSTTQAGGSNDSGTLFRLSFNVPLQITGQPANQSAFLGGSASFSVATFGSLPVFYQWRKDGQNLIEGGNVLGSTARTLTITNITLDDLGVYSVVVSNVQGTVTSANAVLQVTFSPPYFTIQPLPQTRIAGSTATFSVVALGDLPISYQWQKDGTNLNDSGNISGSAATTLTITNIIGANAGVYSVIATNAFAPAFSAGAQLVVVPAAVPGSSATNYHLFTDSTDGAFPYSSLIQGSDGNLYGTSSGGGTKYAGTIFRLSLGGVFTPLYSFLGGDQGTYPYGTLVQATNGTFYGTTLQGGTFNYGTIFKMTSAGTVSLLYSFTGGIDGALPVAGLTLGTDGNFYGTAFQGGANSSGTVFRTTPTGRVSPLHQFTGGPDGAFPYGALNFGADGNLYGTTQGGGADNYGTVFQITTNGTLRTLVSFSYTNGAYPDAGVIQGPDGNLYGATFQGGAGGYGTIFKLSTNGILTTFVSFNYDNGANPVGSLVQGTDGNLYGTTALGGIGGEGTAFSITTNGTMTTLLWFDGLNGASPQAALLQAIDGNFYGTTSYGGVGYNRTAGGGNGTIFRLTVPMFKKNPFTLASAIAALPYSGTISDQAISLPGDTLTFGKLTGPSWLRVSADGSVSGTPTDSDIGDNTFFVSLADTNGFFATATMNLTVNSNQPPFFTSSPFSEPWANVDQTYSGSIASAATDPDLGSGDVLTFAKISGPGWLGVSADGGLFGLPHGSNAGTNTFLVSVTDLDGSSNTAIVYIYVNSAPYFSGLPIVKPSAISRLPYSGTVATNATDPDLGAGDSLAFYKVTGPAWLSVATNGDLAGTAADSDVGTNLFLLLVVDSGGLAGVGTLSITVNADKPPAFTSNPFSAPSAQAGVSYFSSIATNAVDSDSGDKVAFAKVSGPTWLRVGVKGALIGTPPIADVGTNTFLISATDLGGLSTQATMYLSVIAPITLSISQQASQITLSWTGGSPPYQVQTTTALDTSAWSNLGNPLGTNVLVLSPSNASSFYRIQGH